MKVILIDTNVYSAFNAGDPDVVRTFQKADEIHVNSTVIGKLYAHLFLMLRLKGTPIPTNDLCIAASALQNGCVRFSLDSHFYVIEGLRRASPIPVTACRVPFDTKACMSGIVFRKATDLKPSLRSPLSVEFPVPSADALELGTVVAVPAGKSGMHVGPVAWRHRRYRGQQLPPATVAVDSVIRFDRSPEMTVCTDNYAHAVDFDLGGNDGPGTAGSCLGGPTD